MAEYVRNLVVNGLGLVAVFIGYHFVPDKLECQIPTLSLATITFIVVTQVLSIQNKLIANSLILFVVATIYQLIDGHVFSIIDDIGVNSALKLLTIIVGTIVFIVLGPHFDWEEQRTTGMRFIFKREAWASCLALGLAVFFEPSQLVTIDLMTDVFIKKIDIIALILSFAIISDGLGKSGFFHYAAYYIVQKCQGDTHRLVLYLFILTSILTFFTSNDIIVLVLTPIIISVALHANIGNAKLMLLSQFVAANTLSMGLLIGSPTNIIFANELGISFFNYFFIMLPSSLVSFFIAFSVVSWINRKCHVDVLHGKKGRFKQWNFEPSYQKVHSPDHAYITQAMRTWVTIFFLSVLLVAILTWLNIPLIWCAIGTLIIPLLFKNRNPPMSDETLGGGKQQGFKETIDSLPLGIVAFGMSFFILTKALANTELFSQHVNVFIQNAITYESAFTGFVSIVISGVSANIFNDLPASVLMAEIFSNIEFKDDFQKSLAIQGILIGLNIGCYLTPIGALAGLMWFAKMKEAKDDVYHHHMNSKDLYLKGLAKRAQNLKIPSRADLMLYGTINFLVSTLVLGFVLPFFAIVYDFFVGPVRFNIEPIFISSFSAYLNQVFNFESRLIVAFENYTSLGFYLTVYIVTCVFVISLLMFNLVRQASNKSLALTHLGDALVVFTNAQIFISRNKFWFGIALTALCLLLSGWSIRYFEQQHFNLYGKFYKDAYEETQRNYELDLLNTVVACPSRESRDVFNAELNHCLAQDNLVIQHVSKGAEGAQRFTCDTGLHEASSTLNDNQYIFHFDLCEAGAVRGDKQRDDKKHGDEDKSHTCCVHADKTVFFKELITVVFENEQVDDYKKEAVNETELDNFRQPLFEGVRGFIWWFIIFVGSGHDMGLFPRSILGATLVGILPFIFLSLIVYISQRLASGDHGRLSERLATGLFPGQHRIVVMNYYPVFNTFVRRLLDSEKNFVVILCDPQFIEDARVLLNKYFEPKTWGHRAHVASREGFPELVVEHYALFEAEEIYLLSDRTEETDLNNLQYVALLDKKVVSETHVPQVHRTNSLSRLEYSERSFLNKLPKVIVETTRTRTNELVKRSISEQTLNYLVIVNFNDVLAEFLYADGEPSVEAINHFFHLGLKSYQETHMRETLDKIFYNSHSNVFQDKILTEYALDTESSQRLKNYFSWPTDDEGHEHVREQAMEFRIDMDQHIQGLDYIKYPDTVHAMEKLQDVTTLFGFSMRVKESIVRIGLPATSVCRQVDTVEGIVLLEDNDKSEYPYIKSEKNRIIVINLNVISIAFIENFVKKSNEIDVLIFINNEQETPESISRLNDEYGEHLRVVQAGGASIDDMVNALLPTTLDKYLDVNDAHHKNYIQPGDFIYIFLNPNKVLPMQVSRSSLELESVDLIDKLHDRLEGLEKQKLEWQTDTELLLPSHENLYTLVESQGRDSRFLFEHLYIDKIFDNSWIRRSYFSCLAMSYHAPSLETKMRRTSRDFMQANQIAQFMSRFIVRRVEDMLIIQPGAGTVSLINMNVREARTIIRNFAEPSMQLLGVFDIRVDNSRSRQLHLQAIPLTNDIILQKEQWLVCLPLI